jgi:hypothetical protein
LNEKCGRQFISHSPDAALVPLLASRTQLFVKMKLHFALKSLLFLPLVFLGCNKNDCKSNEDKNLKGCGDFFINKIISGDMIASVFIDHTKIAFTEDFQSFEDIAKENFATVEILQNCEIDKVWTGVCNDVFEQTSCANTYWSLQSGKLMFKTDTENCSGTYPYLATVLLYNAVFQKEGSNETKMFDKIEFFNVPVGFGSGG